MNSTEEGIEVKKGQQWRDLNERMNGRLVQVVGVREDGFAYVRQVRQTGLGKLSRISIARMHKHSTGFSLASDPKGADSTEKPDLDLPEGT